MRDMSHKHDKMSLVTTETAGKSGTVRNNADTATSDVSRELNALRQQMNWMVQHVSGKSGARDTLGYNIIPRESTSYQPIDRGYSQPRLAQDMAVQRRERYNHIPPDQLQQWDGMIDQYDSLSIQIHQQARAVESLKRNLSMAEKDNQILNNEVDKLMSGRNALRSTLIAKDNLIDRLTDEVMTLRAAAETAEVNYKSLEEDNRRINQQNERARRQEQALTEMEQQSAAVQDAAEEKARLATAQLELTQMLLKTANATIDERMKEIAQLSQSLSDMSNDFRKQTDAHHQKYNEVRALEMENADLQRANRALMDRLRTQEHLHETEGANDTESTRQHVQREALLTRRLAEAQEEINNLRLQATRAARRMSPTTTHSKTHTQQSTYTINTDAPANGSSPYTHVTESKTHLNTEPPRTIHPKPNYQDRTMHPKSNYQDRTMHPKPNYQDRASASIPRALQRKESTVEVPRGYSPSPTNDRNTLNDGTYQHDMGDVVQGDRQARTTTHTPRNRPSHEHEHEHTEYRPKVHELDGAHTKRWAPVHTQPPAEAKAHTWAREGQAETRRDAQAYGTHPQTNRHAPGPQREVQVQGQEQGGTHGGEHRNSRKDTQAQGNYDRYAYTHSQENGPGIRNQLRAYPRPASATYLTDGRGRSGDEEADEIYSLPTDTRYLPTAAAHARAHNPSEHQHPRGQQDTEHHSVSEPASPLRQLRELRIEDMSQISANGDYNEQIINTTFSSDGQTETYTADMGQGRPRRHSRTEVAAHSWDDRGSADGSEHVWDVVDVSAMDHGDDINTSNARVEQMGNIIDRHIAVLKDKFQQKPDSQR